MPPYLIYEALFVLLFDYCAAEAFGYVDYDILWFYPWDSGYDGLLGYWDYAIVGRIFGFN